MAKSISFDSDYQNIHKELLQQLVFITGPSFSGGFQRTLENLACKLHTVSNSLKGFFWSQLHPLVEASS